MVCHNFFAGLFTLIVSTFVSVSACAVLLLVGCCIVYTYEYDYHV